MQIDYSNRREFTRVPPQMEVIVRGEPGTEIRGQTRDVCMSGLYMECDFKLNPQNSCKISILLSKDNRIEVAGRIVRVDPNGMAILFTEILGLESYEHLRNLLLHNAELTHTIEKELADHVGLRRVSDSFPNHRSKESMPLA